MKRQVLKSLTMLTVIVTVAFAAAVVSANAQSQRRVIANVPFDFVIGDKALPAGEYSANMTTSDASVIVLQRADSNDTAVRITNSILPRPNKTQARLVFHRYGQTYFLAEVWAGGDNIGRQLLPSKQERQMKREVERLAKSHHETVELMATLR
ncbi:MAG: hypothetical protein C5B44_01670 [Acidobacteria bacterium]|nr:MAG: hypothetical protein C5B44_01670 [Acidobacteriota bacterium]